MMEDSHAFQWWRIHVGRWDGLAGQERLFRGFGRKGWAGLCAVGESRFERRRMRRWLRDRYADAGFHWGRTEPCLHWHAALGHYDVPARCVWLPGDRLHGFLSVLADLPPRVHAFPAKSWSGLREAVSWSDLRASDAALNPIAARLLAPRNHVVWQARNGQGLAAPQLISVQDFPRVEHVRLLCRLDGAG